MGFPLFQVQFIFGVRGHGFKLDTNLFSVIGRVVSQVSHREIERDLDGRILRALAEADVADNSTAAGKSRALCQNQSHK